MIRKLVITAGVILAFGLIAITVFYQNDVSETMPHLVARVTPAEISGFARAEGPVPMSFPADHGPHPDFQTEWWYYTGNLQSEDGRRFGFQLTFFRRALRPSAQVPDRSSDWATGQVYMAHFALSDIGGGNFYAFERLSRGAAGLAGAQADPYKVWLENWQVEETASAGECPSGVSQPCWYRLSAAQEGVFLDLILQDSKGVILQGDEGYSQKGPEPGQASYYYSLTRLQAKGQVVINTETFDVSGLSWMDHEWSTSALSKEQEGWDWFSVQLDDGSELMVFQIRRADGTIDPFSSGTLVAANGETTPLKSEDFSITVTDTWTSPDSGATYPAKWIVSIPGDELELQITPHMEDQELNVSYDYWEGAVQIKGTRDGVPVSGNGYVELTGYSGPMGGEF